MAWFFREILTFLLPCLIALGILSPATLPTVTPTPMENRLYTDGEMSVTPDTSKFIDVKVLDEGKDIYSPFIDADFGYRYGPSMLVNADGSIDAWFAAPGREDEWDWILYQHSPDGGKTWTDEKKVLCPTPDSIDYYSVCDPGAVKFGGYYYLGYTSTIYKDGICNNVFVARSVNPDGPFEKWNGSGWGGEPEPIVYYDENWEAWGAGEPSFVVMDDELFIYYTWAGLDETGASNHSVYVSKADATDENWPATMTAGKPAIRHAYPGSDSADVKFIDDYGRFIAVTTSQRMGTDSFISVYESFDGLTFTLCDKLIKNIGWYCHNCGISARPNGHIRLSDKQYIGYAYGPEWGFWGTRLNEIEIELTDSSEYAPDSGENMKIEVEPRNYGKINKYMGITTKPHHLEMNIGGKAQTIEVFKVDYEPHKIFSGVKYSGYDTNIISISSNKVKPLKVGETYVTAEYQGMSVVFKVSVRDKGVPINLENPKIKSISLIQDEYVIPEGGQKQIRLNALYEDNSFFELYAKDGMTFSGYDAGLINIDEKGIITAPTAATGATTVTVNINGEIFDIKVIVI